MSVEIKKLDKRLLKFYNDFLKRWPNSSFIFGGDHGMRTVKEKFNIIQVVNNIASKLNLKFGEDFIYFVDSTMFRLWGLKNLDIEIFTRELKKSALLKYGQFISKEVGITNNIPRNNKKYGDVLWIANKGVLLSPDFFHKDISPKGMHGYFPGEKHEHGMCIIIGKNIKPHVVDKVKLIHIYDILKTQLNLK